MFDGVIPLGVSVAAARSFWAVHGGWRQRVFGSWPRRICVIEGLARGESSCGQERLVAELAQRVVAALEQFAGKRQAGAVAAQPLGGLEVVRAVRAARMPGLLGRLIQSPAQRWRSLPGELAGRAMLV
jgi:hypothetical protein